MSIFGGKSKQRTSLTGENSREAVTASLRSVQAPHYARTAMREGPKQPDNNIGVAKLLEVYDDYPIVVHSLEQTTERLDAAEDAAREAERKRDEVQAELDDEKKMRQQDAKDAAEDKRRSVIAKEKAVRDELDPKIKDLTNRLAQVTKDRDAAQKEIRERKVEMKKWIDGMQRLHAERANAAELERKAAESKKSVDERLRDLDKTILEGLKKHTGAATVDTTEAFASDTRSPVKAKVSAWEEKSEKSDRPRFVEHNEPTTPVTPARTRAWDSDHVNAEDQAAMANPEPKLEREVTSTRKSLAADFGRRKSMGTPAPESPAPAVTSPRKSIAPDTPAAKTGDSPENATPLKPNAARRKSSFSTSKKKKNDEYGSALDDMLAGKIGK